jgi:ribosomal protein S27AE
MRSHSCPKCQATMAEGFVVDRDYGSKYAVRWAEGGPEKSVWGGIKLRGKTLRTVQSWRCNRCGYLENYAF